MRKYNLRDNKLYYEIILPVKYDVTPEDSVETLFDALSSDDKFDIEIAYGEYWGLRNIFLSDRKKVSAHYFYFQVGLKENVNVAQIIKTIKQNIVRSEYVIKGAVFKLENLNELKKQTLMLTQTLQSIQEESQEEDPDKIVIPSEYNKVIEQITKRFAS